MSEIANINYVADYAVGGHTFDGDAGINLKFTKIHETLFDGEIVIYDTGFALTPAIGYYTEIVARSSLGKTGWLINNSIGIIDAAYTGTIKVAMSRIVRVAPELKLGESYVQLIARKLIKIRANRVDKLETTERGSKGFGDGEKSQILSVQGEKSQILSVRDVQPAVTMRVNNNSQVCRRLTRLNSNANTNTFEVTIDDSDDEEAKIYKSSARRRRINKNYEKKPESMYYETHKDDLIKSHPNERGLMVFQRAREEYKKLTPEEKQVYIEKAAVFNAERCARNAKIEPVKIDADDEKRRKRRLRKIVNKKPESIYFDEHKAEIVFAHPDANGLNAFKFARDAYNELSNEQQQEYIEKAAAFNVEALAQNAKLRSEHKDLREKLAEINDERKRILNEHAEIESKLYVSDDNDSDSDSKSDSSGNSDSDSD